MPARMLVVDDHVIIREGMDRIFRGDSEFKIVGTASDGLEAVKLARELMPELILMDITMPLMNGIEATKQILDEMPGIKIVGLSMHLDRRFIVQMLRAGASGYILKHAELDELRNGLRTVLQGRIYLGTGARELVSNASHEEGREVSGIVETLSRREREVLQLIAEGINTKQIAGHLGVRPKTVDTIRLRLMNKLDIYSVAELTKFALREGLTNLDI